MKSTTSTLRNPISVLFLLFSTLPLLTLGAPAALPNPAPEAKDVFRAHSSQAQDTTSLAKHAVGHHGTNVHWPSSMKRDVAQVEAVEAATAAEEAGYFFPPWNPPPVRVPFSFSLYLSVLL
jgi:hypothetical protein